jgi:hypothetical protein
LSDIGINVVANTDIPKNTNGYHHSGIYQKPMIIKTIDARAHIEPTNFKNSLFLSTKRSDGDW